MPQMTIIQRTKVVEFWHQYILVEFWYQIYFENSECKLKNINNILRLTKCGLFRRLHRHSYHTCLFIFQVQIIIYFASNHNK